MLRKLFLIYLILFNSSNNLSGQNLLELFGFSDPTIAIIPISESNLHACIDNSIRVFARQQRPIELKDINAKLIYNYSIVNDSIIQNSKDLKLREIGINEFQITGIDAVGTIEFIIKLNSKIVTKKLKVHPLNVNFVIGTKFLPEQKIDRKYFHDNFPRMLCNINFDGIEGRGTIKSYNLTTLSKLTGTFKSRIINAKNINEIKNAITILNSGDQVIISEIIYSTPCWQNKTHEQNYIIELK